MGNISITREAGELGRRPDLLRYFIDDVIGKKVKMDYPTKVSCFCAGLSAYTPEPMNLFLKEESGTGKTYNAVNSLNMFPEKDVWALGGLSPTALTHLYGTLYDENGDEIREEDRPRKEDFKEKKEFQEEIQKWRERIRGSYSLIDLSGKILLFLESPHIRTFQMMYPILSHDKKQIEYRITDKSSKGQLVTAHIIIKGWPATVFCTTSDKTVEELATRCFTTSPERTPSKFRAAHEVSALKNEAPWILDEWDSEETAARYFINHYKEQMKNIAGISNPFSRILAQHYPAEIRRDMRDFSQFLRIIKSLASLHFKQRPRIKRNDKQYVVATLTDIENAKQIFSNIFEPTRANISLHKLDFHYDVVATQDMWKAKELTAAYNARYPQKRSSKTVKRYLSELADAGYVDIQPDPDDKRVNMYQPLIKMRTQLDIFKEGVISASDYEAGLEKWLNQYGQNLEYYVYNSAQLMEADAASFQEEVLSKQNPIFCPYLNKKESGSESEKKAESMDIAEEGVIVHNSNPPKTTAFYTRIFPDKVCGKCGLRPASFQVEIDGSELKRCETCFNEMRGTLKKIKFMRKEEKE